MKRLCAVVTLAAALIFGVLPVATAAPAGHPAALELPGCC